MTIIGFVAGGAVVVWGAYSSGVGSNIVNAHGLVIVLGGTLASTLINTSYKRFIAGLKALLDIFSTPKTPPMDVTVRTLVSMAEAAQK